jgi:hypothetical protein
VNADEPRVVAKPLADCGEPGRIVLLSDRLDRRCADVRVRIASQLDEVPRRKARAPAE